MVRLCVKRCVVLGVIVCYKLTVTLFFPREAHGMETFESDLLPNEKLFSLTHLSNSQLKKGRILEPALFPRLFTNPSQLCSFANCTHVLQNLSHGPSHAQATRPDGGQAGVGQQLPRNPGNILLRPPVSALG